MVQCQFAESCLINGVQTSIMRVCATQKLVDRINACWLTEYRIDGFRFDFTKGFTNTPGDGAGYDASRIAIIKKDG